MELNLWQCSANMVTHIPHVTSPVISGAPRKSLPLFFADVAHGLFHEIPGLCGHHAAELSHNAVSDYFSAGRKARKEEGQ